MMIAFYDRNGKQMTMLEWSKVYEDTEYRILGSHYIDNLWVSTVWLGLDHRFLDEGPPLIFESMVFAVPDGDDRWEAIEMRRYATEKEAMVGHAELVAHYKTERSEMTDDNGPVHRFTITSMEGEHPGVDTHQIKSEYVEINWLPFLGPTALLFARRIDHILTTDGKNAVGIKVWGELLSVKPEEILLAANRLIRFGLATWSDRDKTLLISRHWPSVPMAIMTAQHRHVLLDLPDVEVTA